MPEPGADPGRARRRTPPDDLGDRAATVDRADEAELLGVDGQDQIGIDVTPIDEDRGRALGQSLLHD